MKTNFTYTLLLCLVLSIVTFSVNAQVTAQPSFSAAPSLIPGSGSALQVGAKYRFSNVSTGTDAIVTIMNRTNGATISVLDDNNITKPEAFSPNITVPGNKNGYVEFKIDFVVNNTLSNIAVDTLFATAIDIDGSSQIKEYDVIDLGGGTAYFMSANPQISITQSGTAFTGKNIGGVNYNSIDTAAKNVMFTVKKNNVTSFIYRAGVQNDGNSSTTRQKSIYFKNFFYPAGSALPVKYSSFDAVANDKVVNLKWVTESEINNSHFEVERSFDGTNFSTLGLVLDAASVYGSSKTYLYKDNGVELASKSVAYYRLKQIDLNGRVTYSNVLTVRLQSKTSDVKMQVSPNPFVENLNLQFTSTEKANAQVQIIAIGGQKVVTQQASISKGYNTIQVQGLSKLVPGVYMAQLIVNGVITDTQKIIKN